MINLYLIRHSIAEKISLQRKDFERQLSPEGIELIKTAVKYWKSVIPALDFIITSPLVRAVQTGKLIAENMNYKGEIITDNNLAPGSRTNDVMEILKTYGKENIACIGHQPELSMHVSNFISSNGCVLHFPPAAICKIRFMGSPNYAKGELIYLIPPDIFQI